MSSSFSSRLSSQGVGHSLYLSVYHILDRGEGKGCVAGEGEAEEGEKEEKGMKERERVKRQHIQPHSKTLIAILQYTRTHVLHNNYLLCSLRITSTYGRRMPTFHLYCSKKVH